MNIKKLACFALIASGMVYASTATAQKDVRDSGATFPSIIYSN